MSEATPLICCVQAGEWTVCGEPAMAHRITDTQIGPFIICLCRKHREAWAKADAEWERRLSEGRRRG